MQTRRFGKRLIVPSTLQARRELRLFSAQQDARQPCGPEVQLPAHSPTTIVPNPKAS